MPDSIALTDLTVKLRAGSSAQACSEICYNAFKTINEQHGFPPDFFRAWNDPRHDVHAVFSPWCLCSGSWSGWQIVGSNFLWEESAIVGVGPTTVAPHIQDASLFDGSSAGTGKTTRVCGRAPMQRLFIIDRCHSIPNLGLTYRTLVICKASIRTEHSRLRSSPSNRGSRSCGRLCQRVHGFDRNREHAIQRGTATVVEHDGRITGYATTIGFFVMLWVKPMKTKALIGAANPLTDLVFFLPTRTVNCSSLQQGASCVQPMILMSLGFYNQPAGAFCPPFCFEWTARNLLQPQEKTMNCWRCIMEIWIRLCAMSLLQLNSHP